MSKLIAVIDDDPDIVQVLKATLRSRGYDVVSAYDGDEGLQLIQSTRPDLIILDLKMPRVSGLEVTKRLREDPELKEIPVIILSAIGANSGRSEEFWRAGLGTDDFISKPYDPTTLLGRVEYLLRRRQYVSARRPGNGNGAEAAEAVPRTPLSRATPREIVRCFIESWNSQNFGEEFGCIAESMRGPLPRTEYVLRRQQAYAGASSHQQRLLAVIEENVADDAARLLVEREESANNRTSRRREEYRLKKTDEGWKIFGVRVVPTEKKSR